MKLQIGQGKFLVVAAMFLLGGIHSRAFSQSSRLTMTADRQWRFHLGEAQGAESLGFNDGNWRTVNLPHDWSIEDSPKADNPSGAGGGFFRTGLGWYRKSFRASPDWAGRRVYVEFDGIYRDATVYLNGVKLLTQPYGYTSFSVDLTKGLKLGAENILAVRVDNSAQPNSRWYTGSGIYRHVRFVVTQPSHVAHWGVAITTPEVSRDSARVNLRTKMDLASGQSGEFKLVTTLFDSKNTKVGSVATPVSGTDRNAELSQTVEVKRPVLWSPATPILYRAVTQLQQNGRVIDEVATPFGIRSLSWSATSGLLLNGQTIKLTGGSVHHDDGPLGAAAFDRAEERKVALLKAAGYNAVRTAHNIPSPAFLDACDRQGLLVLEEPFDTWEAHKVKADYGTDFDANWKADISAMVLRDRNHPSIIIWGIGNEIPEVTVDKGAGLAKELAAQVRSLDNSRPLTLAFPGTTTAATAQAVFSQLDITGYNYSLEKSYKQDHEALPNRLMVTTESFPAKAFELWEISTSHPYVLGDFVWTAMDYLGESGIGAWSYGTPEEAKMAGLIMGSMMTTGTIDKMFNGMAKGVDMEAAMKTQSTDPQAKAAMAIMTHEFPWHASDCGDLDLTGFRKPQSYYRDIVWNGGDRAYITVQQPAPPGKAIIAVGWATYPTLPSWNWAGQEGQPLEVEVYSSAEQIQLFLNGKMLAEQPGGRDHEFKAVFKVPYAPGELKAIALRNGKPVAESMLATTGPATRLRLTPDRKALNADGQDLAFVTVEAVDGQGRLVQTADDLVDFSVDGQGTIAAVGNGDGEDPTSYVSPHRKLFHGRALVVLRSEASKGAMTLRAQSQHLPVSEVSVATSDATGLTHEIR